MWSTPTVPLKDVAKRYVRGNTIFFSLIKKLSDGVGFFTTFTLIKLANLKMAQTNISGHILNRCLSFEAPQKLPYIRYKDNFAPEDISFSYYLYDGEQ